MLFSFAVNQPHNMSNTANNTAPKSIKILATFETVLEALEASTLDIAYNPEAAKSKAKDCNRPNRYFEPGPAFLCEDGEIRQLIKCADGLRILNTFDPFISCLDDSPFRLATVKDNEITIYNGLTFPKSARKALAKLDGFCVC